MIRSALVIAIVCASLSVMLSTGIRSSFGLFLQPISDTLGTGREVFSLAIAINNIIYGLPLVGLIADKIGPRWVIIAGGLLYAGGLLLMTTIVQPMGLYLSLGFMVGLALSATTYVVVLGAVAQIVPAQRRSQTFGIITAAGSSGMFVVPPLAQILLSSYGWQSALVILAGVAALIVLLAFGLSGKPGHPVSATASTDDEPFIEILKKARRHKGYLLLITGFFVCGFHVAFIATHLPAFLGDNGLSPAVGAAALSLIGAFNIVGSYSFGWLGDKFRKKYLLSFLYFGRAVVITLFLLFPITQTSTLIFSGAIGFLWLATVPLTSGTVAQIFGIRYLSTLYGVVFFSHQVGAFLGVWLGGRLYDTMGSYTPVWIMAIILGIFAAVVHTPISDKPIARPQPA